MRTREDFCRDLLDDDSFRESLDPETLAARFVRYFDVPTRPSMEHLKALLKRTGFGEVSGSRHMDAKGIHFSSPNGGYDIHYRADLWAGAQDSTVLHETLCEMHSGYQPDRKVCMQANRFAAAVLMQPDSFRPLAGKSGLKEIQVKPGKAGIIYSMPTPDDSPLGGADSAEIVLNGGVRSTVRSGGPGWTRTNDLGLIRTAL